VSTRLPGTLPPTDSGVCETTCAPLVADIDSASTAARARPPP
jgi:hypothetical protein